MLGFPKPKPHILRDRDDKRELAKQQRAVYAEVDARDQKRCRCCGRRGNPEAITALERIHRHHIVERSRGGVMEAWNILSTCWICHALIHAKQLFLDGFDANKRIDFEIHEAAVVHVFGTKEVPTHVHIIRDV